MTSEGRQTTLWGNALATRHIYSTRSGDLARLTARDTFWGSC